MYHQNWWLIDKTSSGANEGLALKHQWDGMGWDLPSQLRSAAATGEGAVTSRMTPTTVYACPTSSSMQAENEKELKIHPRVLQHPRAVGRAGIAVPTSHRTSKLKSLLWGQDYLALPLTSREDASLAICCY